MHLSHLPDHYQPDYCRDTLKIPPSCPHDAAAPLTYEYRNNQFPQFIFVENFSTNARPTYARESPISSFFFFFSRERKKKKEYRPTSIVHAEQQLISRFLDSVYVIISITPREMLLQHRNSMLFDRFIALSLLDSCQKKKGKKKERGTKEDRTASDRFRRCNAVMN